ncbi:uncharacterized protein Dwil_GK18917 [Drosophila willistoni]|uniref:Large ribosomal subunit protein mL64 n=1 Tax=Drosophila willistoni TaxID=7260 RepID=B4MXQ5_DROWI|nr:growth arrest and DNA damage-inducible proteins-interacting protein 1 [Drosophila willistoni]EDW76824.1 uncharacterized protein Dwil_GK18917 [Drosophila willistoni]
MNYLRKTATNFPARLIRLQHAGSASVELPAAIINEDGEDVSSSRKVKFDKSNLRQQHKNVLFECPPYQEEQSWIHLTEKYQRKAFGRYGSKSNINPRICFDSAAGTGTAARQPTQNNDLNTLQKMLEKSRIEHEEKIQTIVAREEAISKKMEKLDQWKKDLNAKVAKKEADAAAAIQRKERLIEEVRRHFGYKVDPRDERFQEMLEQKEKEDKRKQKEAKRKAKDEKMMAKLVEKSTA